MPRTSIVVRDADGLTPEQQKALVSLLNSAYMTKASEASGIGSDTLYHWLADPDHPLTIAYNRARSQAFAHALGTLQLRAANAVETLVAALEPSNGITPQQAKAASEVIHLALRSFETVETVSRIARIERALEEG